MTLRSWLWLGSTAITLAIGASPSVHAQVIIGGNGSTEIAMDPQHLPHPPQLQLGTFTGTKPLMPLEPTNGTQQIILTRPGTTSTVSSNTPLVPLQKPDGGYKLVIPEEKKITLTPPPGVKVYLMPPVAKKVAKPRKKVAKVAAKPVRKTVAKATPKPIKLAKAEPTPLPTAVKAPETPKPTAPAKAAPVKAEAPQPIAAPVVKVDTPEPQQASLPTPAAKTASKQAPKLPEPPKAPEAPTPIAEAPDVPVIAPAPPPAPAKLADVPPPQEVQVAAITKPETPSTPNASTPENTTVALVFESGDAHLDDAHRSLLKGVVSELEANPDSAVQLMAYAKAENRSKARRLSLSRALAARSFLLQQNIRNTRIQVRAMGDQVPSGKSDRVDVIIKQP